MYWKRGSRGPARFDGPAPAGDVRRIVADMERQVAAAAAVKATQTPGRTSARHENTQNTAKLFYRCFVSGL